MMKKKRKIIISSTYSTPIRQFILEIFFFNFSLTQNKSQNKNSKINIEFIWFIINIPGTIDEDLFSEESVSRPGRTN